MTDKPDYPMDWKIKEHQEDLGRFIKNYIVDNNSSVKAIAKEIKISYITVKRFLMGVNSHPLSVWKIMDWVELKKKQLK